MIPFKLSSACPYERAAIALRRKAVPPSPWKSHLSAVGIALGRVWGTPRLGGGIVWADA